MRGCALVLLSVAAGCSFDSGLSGSGGNLGGATEGTGSTGTGSSGLPGGSSSTSPGTTSGDPQPTTSPDPSAGSGTTVSLGSTSSSTGSGSDTSTGEDLDIEVAEKLLVSLDAVGGDVTNGGWINTGSMGDFDAIGNPVPGMIGGLMAARVSTGNGYVSAEDAPETLVGVDPTRTIEVWAYNPNTASEETMVAWGRRGGPDGSNIAFLYGDDPNDGAVSQWFIDLGWGDPVPATGEWHHLVYAFEPGLTRIFADGELANELSSAIGEVNTHDGEPILIGAQHQPVGSYERWGSLAIARVRVHAGTLSEAQIIANYEFERDEFQR